MVQISSHKAPVDEVLRLEVLYRERYAIRYFTFYFDYSMLRWCNVLC